MENPRTAQTLARYLDNVALLERMHRLLLDVIKDEFERLGIVDINPVQALLLFNVADNEVTASELKSRGYYQGSNVSYNLKKLVDLGYMHHQRCRVDRRAVRIRLTAKGRGIRDHVAALFERHAQRMDAEHILSFDMFDSTARTLRRMERFWGDQIRYIY
jgi:DNA-binding MarR family transcriptional regulator